MSRVNVYSEWGRLREIVVGNLAMVDRVNVDLSFRLFYHQNIKDVFLKNSFQLQARLIEQRQEDLDGLARTLESLGVVVHRPRKIEKLETFKTPHFEAHTHACANPRDQVLVLGDEVIETSCLNRTRYFENDLLKPIFYQYFRAGSRWTCAPRPMMRDESFDLSLVRKDPGKWAEWGNREPSPSDFEIMFDGAQCLKFGRDIVMNVANGNQALGADWLERHLEGRFRIHRVALTDYHLDGMFMPLRPGVLLVNPSSMASKLELLPEPLRKWEILVVPEQDPSTYQADSVLLASANIFVNVLPIDEKRVIVFDGGVDGPSALARLLEAKGFEPLPVRLRHSRVFDGGAHCATLDMVRDGGPEDYFA